MYILPLHSHRLSSFISESLRDRGTCLSDLLTVNFSMWPRLCRARCLWAGSVAWVQDVVVVEALVLDEVAPGPYTMHCLPLKLVGSDGAPARCILVT